MAGKGNKVKAHRLLNAATEQLLSAPEMVQGYLYIKRLRITNKHELRLKLSCFYKHCDTAWDYPIGTESTDILPVFEHVQRLYVVHLAHSHFYAPHADDECCCWCGYRFGPPPFLAVSNDREHNASQFYDSITDHMHDTHGGFLEHWKSSLAENALNF